MEKTKRTFKIIHSKNLSPFSILALDFQNRFQEVNQPLPWIEPSINMIHLDAVRAYVFGSSLASIGCAVYLLEHSLRMAIWDDQESGSRRKELSNKIFDENLTALLSADKFQSKRAKIIPDADDLEWWKAVTKAVRNKVNH